MRIAVAGLFAAIICAIASAGCGSPSSANIALRKQLQQRDDQVASLNRQHEGDLADARSAHGPTTNSISPDLLARLYTVHGLSFGRLTGGSNLDSGKQGDQGLKIFVVPTDDDGQPIKAAGSFHIEAFDLAAPDNVVGKWDFDTAAARQNWFGAAMLYNFVLPCPWKAAPRHSELTVRVTFHDELTGREFTEQRAVHVQLSPATAP